MERQHDAIVIGSDGWQGTLVSTPTDGTEYAIVRLDDGQTLHVPLSYLHAEAENRYRLDLSRADLTRFLGNRDTAVARDLAQTVIPVVEEHLSVEKREVEAGRVRIHKQVQEREEVVEVPLMREEVHVERVPVNRYLDGSAAPTVRNEGETMIIPLVEEVLVVEKRLLLREELHVTKRRTESTTQQSVTLRREDVVVENVDADGNSHHVNPSTTP